MEIMRAQRRHAARVFELLGEFARAENQPVPDPTLYFKFLDDGWGATPRFEAWLVVIDGIEVALALAFNIYSSFQAKQVLYLEDLFVVNSRRRQGIASALVQHLANSAIERGYARLDWSCKGDNPAASSLYRKVCDREQPKTSYSIVTKRERNPTGDAEKLLRWQSICRNLVSQA
ncbi:hypothetical protein MMA231_03990 (plasmid) [Asticcacaulis sp. MM231]|uniref:GNAT family N-acetyltransferase n=1 Tax=Asticcacaulis sp. MM231 TaxID=3157666 RepID=UPI0032D59E59